MKTEAAAIEQEWQALLEEHRGMARLGAVPPSDLPSARRLLARPKEQGAAVVAAGLRVLAGTSLEARTQHANARGLVGEADHVIGAVMSALLRRRIPIDEEGARELLRALLQLAPRMHDVGIVALDYLFPFHALVAALDRCRVASMGSLQHEVAALADAIRGQPELRERARAASILALDDELAGRERRDAGAAALRRSALVAASEDALRRARDRPEAAFRPALRRSLAKIESWLMNPPEARAMPREPQDPSPSEVAAAPERVVAPRGKSRRQRPATDLARKLFRDRLHAVLPCFAIDGRPAAPGCRIFFWQARPNLAFFVEFQPDTRFLRSQFTVNVGWNTVLERSLADPQARLETSAGACLRLGHLMPDGSDRWWSLLPPCSQAGDMREAWRAMSLAAREEALLLSPFQSEAARSLDELWPAMSPEEREELGEHVARWIMTQERPEDASARIGALVEEAIRAVERHAMPLFRRVLSEREGSR